MIGRHGQQILIAGLGAALLAMLAWLFDQRLRKGDVFPAYSSFRCDPLGTRALHDSLAMLPAMRVERFYQPLERLPAHPPRTILLAGLSLSRWEQTTAEEAGALDAAVRAGSRVVVVFAAEFAPRDTPARPPGDEPAGGDHEKTPSGRPSDHSPPPADEDNMVGRPKPADWRGIWGVEVERQRFLFNPAGAHVTEAAVAALPESVPWQSGLCFKTETAPAWSVLYRHGDRPVMVERALGRGSIVLAGDAFFVSNEALQRARAPALLSWLIGPNRHVLFVESHLGVVDESGLAALARRYGLGAAAGVALVLAALFVWRETAPFLPPPSSSTEIAVSTDAGAGLVALLRRALPVQRLPEACVEEWRRAGSLLHPGSTAPAARVEAVWQIRQSATGPGPAAAYNALVRALRRRG